MTKKGKLVPIDFSKIPVVNLCPKCGSEMADEYRTSNGYRYPVGICYKCGVIVMADDDECGHEEKVKEVRGR